MEFLENHRENAADGSSGEVSVDREVEIVEENGNLNGVASRKNEGCHDHTLNTTNTNTATGFLLPILTPSWRLLIY